MIELTVAAENAEQLLAKLVDVATALEVGVGASAGVVAEPEHQAADVAEPYVPIEPAPADNAGLAAQVKEVWPANPSPRSDPPAEPKPDAPAPGTIGNPA